MSQESIFSKEKSERCDLPVIPPIPDVPEIVECEMGPVPGEKVACREKTILFTIQEVDEFGNLAWEVARDGNGEPILTGGLPTIVGALMVEKAFRCYEIIPPRQYRTAIDGQPAVNLYVGMEEVLEFQE